MKNSQLYLANEFIRWIVVDGTKKKGTKRHAIFDNNQAKDAAMGGVEKGKWNNLSIHKLMKEAITWAELLEEIKKFLTLSESG